MPKLKEHTMPNYLEHIMNPCGESYIALNNTKEYTRETYKFAYETYVEKPAGSSVYLFGSTESHPAYRPEEGRPGLCLVKIGKSAKPYDRVNNVEAPVDHFIDPSKPFVLGHTESFGNAEELEKLAQKIFVESMEINMGMKDCKVKGKKDWFYSPNFYAPMFAILAAIEELPYIDKHFTAPHTSMWFTDAPHLNTYGTNDYLQLHNYANIFQSESIEKGWKDSNWSFGIKSLLNQNLHIPMLPTRLFSIHQERNNHPVSLYRALITEMVDPLEIQNILSSVIRTEYRLLTAELERSMKEAS